MESTSDTPGSPLKDRRFGHEPALDGLRGLAISLVLIGHCVTWLQPHVGVTVFFVLSGFLITTLLLKEFDAKGNISLRRFYERRALRLLPALVVVLAAALVAGYWQYALIALLYTANVLAGANRSLGPLTHTWSLAQEEQFYAVWPIVLLAMLRRGWQPRSILLVTAALASIIVAWRTYLGLSGVDTSRLAFAPDTQADAVLLGCCVAIVAYRRVIPSSRWLMAAGFAVLGWLFVSQSAFAARYGFAPAALASAALLVWALGAPALLRARPLAFVGTISYGLYLWDWPLVYWLHRPIIVLPLTVVLAVVSHRFVERPFLRRKERLAS